MKIEHIALWTTQLEIMRAFYIKYFKTSSSAKYYNEKKGFSSYFLSFEEGARIELMHIENLEKSKKMSDLTGYIHLSISVYSKNKVDELFALIEIERTNAGDKINLFPEITKPAKFDYPKKKLPTAFPAGGLAPLDPNFKKITNDN